jgi:hypothetical protein
VTAGDDRALLTCVCEECLAARKALLDADTQIERAYWLFTRTARAKPPALAVPHAYAAQRLAIMKLARHRPRHPLRKHMQAR